MVFVCGERVEVIGVDVGFENSYFGASVVEVDGAAVSVVYETLVDDDSDALGERVHVCRVRLYPDDVEVELEVGDIVDVFERQGWWEGRIVAERVHIVTVVFEYVEDWQREKVYRREELRIHQHWLGKDESPYWVYRRGRKNLEVGDRVEVLGWERGLENPFFLAYVIGVGVGTVTVRYKTLYREGRGGLLEEEVLVRRVRPYPAKVDTILGIRSIVDVWYGSGWWKGTIMSESADSFLVFFDYMVEGQQESWYRNHVVRVHQVLQVAEDACHWSYGILGVCKGVCGWACFF